MHSYCLKDECFTWKKKVSLTLVPGQVLELLGAVPCTNILFWNSITLLSKPQVLIILFNYDKNLFQDTTGQKYEPNTQLQSLELGFQALCCV